MRKKLSNGHSPANLANSSNRQKFAIFGEFEYSPKWPFWKCVGLARLAEICQVVLRGLARLADIRRAVLRGLAKLANIRQTIYRVLARLPRLADIRQRPFMRKK
jgi:hypothetical protein